MNRPILFLAVFFSILPSLGIAQTEVKVMSYNIRLNVASDGENRWEARRERLAALVNYNDPAFVGMQEVTHAQLMYLNENLIGYNYIGVGRDDGKEAGEYSCIYYKKEAYKKIIASTFWLSPTPDLPSIGWDAAYKRVCTYGLFKNKKTKQKFWVFNTHFDHIGKDARLNSAKLILDKIKTLNVKNYPVILTGDFNATPEDLPIMELKSTLSDTRSMSKLVYGDAATFNGFKFNEKLTNRIDYIFVNRDKNITVKKYATLTDSYDLKYPSDHLPVIAFLLIKK